MGNRDWTEPENGIIVATYFTMLELQVTGQLVLKADFKRQLAVDLPNRTVGAIDYKLGNVSAVARDSGLAVLDGYAPAPNYQESLRRAVSDHLDRHPLLLAMIRRPDR